MARESKPLHRPDSSTAGAVSIFAYDPQGDWPNQREQDLALIDEHERGWHNSCPDSRCPDCQKEKLAREAERNMRNHPNARQALLDRAARRGHKAEAERYFSDRDKNK